MAGVFTSFNSLHALGNWSDQLPDTELMPVLFLGHGSPMNAIEENQFVRGFRHAAVSLPKPVAILCVSAHWFTRGTMVTAMEQPRTIHDFGGFPKALFDVQYPAKGHPQLAAETRTLLGEHLVSADTQWGLDHGAWTVIMHLFPKADVPVIQLSIDYTKPPAWHFELASRLHVLRKKGVLILGSGNIVHNLSLVDFANINREDYGYDWAREARATINDRILAHDFEAILTYPKLGRAVQLAAPSPDHFLPLVYALGLSGKNEPLHLFNDQMVGGSLSMTSLRIG